MDGSNIENCYNVATISEQGNASVVGSIVGSISSKTARGSISNCYYLEGTQINAYMDYTNSYVGKTDGKMTKEEMKGKAFVEILGDAFKQDTNNINDGFPIFKWQQ